MEELETGQSPKVEARAQRIVSNTFFVFVRLVLVMGVMLYTSRVVFAELGVVDFGLFTLLWGLVSSFIFFSSSLSNATQRFLAYEYGRGDWEAMRRIFATSLGINLMLALIATAVGEALGLYLIYYHLDIPAERLGAVVCIFHTMMASLIIQLVGFAYESVLIAREELRVYAWIGIAEALLKLLIIYLLSVATGDKLVLYTVLFVLALLAVRLPLALLCTRRYSECRIEWHVDMALLRRMLAFIGWDSLSSAVGVFCNQAGDVFLNIFFGPVMSAARGISAQVNSAVGSFSAGLLTAVRSQITASYATGDMLYLERLVYRSARYSAYVLWLISLPFILRMQAVLELWLGEVPEHAASLTVWMLLSRIPDVMYPPLWYTVQATGRIRRYVIVGSLISLASLPVIYIGLMMGQPGVYVLQVVTGMRLAYLLGSFWVLRREMPLSWWSFGRRVLLPVALVCGLSAGMMYLVEPYMSANLWGLIGVFASSAVSVLLCIAIVGSEPHERQYLLSYLKSSK